MNHESTPLRRLNRPYWIEADDERPPLSPACEEDEEGSNHPLTVSAATPAHPARPKRAYRPRTAPAGAQVSGPQLQQLQAVAQTYTPDMDDAAAVEVLLVLLEVGHILELSEGQIDRIFGRRCRRVLDTWGDVLPPRARAAEVQRAWVWLPNRRGPALYPIGEDGAIRVEEVV